MTTASARGVARPRPRGGGSAARPRKARDAKRGEYLVDAGGCVGCHTEDKKDAVPFAGGRALKTPFGTFYGPNITPHPQAGIGRWTEADFIRAMREGNGPGRRALLPGVPVSVVHENHRRAICATSARTCARCRRTRAEPAARARLSRTASGSRSRGWKWLFFTPGPFVPDPKASAEVNRGAYLVQALGHCGECHTPRNSLGGPKRDRFLAGGKGPEEQEHPEPDADPAQEAERRRS